MKKFVSSILASIMLISVASGTFAADEDTTWGLSSRATVEVKDGKLYGLTEPVDGATLRSQFTGDVKIISADGTEIDDNSAVPSDSAVMWGDDVIAAVTVPGDAAMDGGITLADASAMLKHIAGWDTPVSMAASDVNRDGAVNLGDVSTILKYIAGWDVQIFDDPVMIDVFTAGVTEYKILAGDPETDAAIQRGIRMLTGKEIPIVDSVSDGERFITAGLDLHEKYDFIDGISVPADSAYLDTYGGNLYLTASTEGGLARCIDYVSYRAFDEEQNLLVPKGFAGAVDVDTVKYTDIIKANVPVHTLIVPVHQAYTADDGAELIKSKIAELFYPKYNVYTDDDDDAVHGEYESSYAEILVGQTNRVESREVFISLSEGEYAIKVIDDKIVIVGYTDWLTYLAAEYFANNVVYAEDGNFKLPADLSIVHRPYENINEEKPDAVFDDVQVQGETIATSCERWIATEIEFTSDRDYDDPVYTMTMDAYFRNKDTGTVYAVPAFWDGGRNFKVRFALTEAGEWEFYTICSDTDNAGLHHRGGTVICGEYTGELDIYKHGFIKTVPGKNYFVYDDGTPFFYLGDTHWSLPLEEIDSYGSVETQKSSGITEEIAEEYGITSQFKYIMDYRAEQGYTVIQSQPLGWWTEPGTNSWFADDGGSIYTYGVNDTILEKFREYDRHFAYIAEVGLVHANAQFSCVSTLMFDYFDGKVTDEELEMLSRYWVARYSAYPVLWTTAQESDNDYYGEDRDYHKGTPENNPWHLVMDYVHKYDPYAHPSTAHQEHWFYTDATKSSFADKDAHTWYAAQYHLMLHLEDPYTWQFLRDYYGNPGSKPAINFEGRYDHFWVGTYGARAQGWQAFLNGNFGYGYGVQPIWAFNWAAGEGIDESADELGPYNRDDNWLEGLYAEGGEQVTYIKELLEKYEWWRLTPCFNGSYYYEPNGWGYSVSNIGNDVYLGYFYGTDAGYRGLGTLRSMKTGDYTVTWFNCRTGEYTDSITVNVTNGTYKIPAKPGDGDWTVIVEYTGNGVK